MKKFISVFLLICLLLGLVACGQKEETLETPPTTEPVVTEPAPTEPEPTEPVVTEPAYRHPLTGEGLDAPWTGRPSSVSLGNTKKAMPQHGVNQAALIYEAEVEGSSTRIMAVFGDVQDLQPIGPIRSARTFFNNISESMDSVIFHAGGSVRGRNGYYDLTGGKIKDWEHINALYGSTSNYFYRDKDRRNQGYNLEHTMFTNGEKMQKALEKKEYIKVNEGGTVTGLNFVADFPLTGATANKVTVEFKAGKQSVFTYDATTGLYSASQYKADWIDGNTGEVQKFKNLVILKADQKTKSDGEYPRSYYTLLGEGTGWIAIDGQMAEITWTRAELQDPFVYTLADGTAVSFEPGRTYTAITDAKTPVVSE